jgi:hypothetical protein
MSVSIWLGCQVDRPLQTEWLCRRPSLLISAQAPVASTQTDGVIASLVTPPTRWLKMALEAPRSQATGQ